MPLSYEALAHMQAEMLDRYNLQAVEVRLSGENIAQLQQTNYYGSPIALRYMPLPVNTIEFFVPRLHRHISLNDWDNFSGWPGTLTYSVRSGASQSTYTPPTERTFMFDGETFVCRLSVEPVPAEPLPAEPIPGVYTFEFTPLAPQPNRIDFLLEVLDDGVDEPHAED